MPKRLMSVMVTTALLFVGLFGRLYGLSTGTLKAASLAQSTRTQTLYVSRGTIYDRYLRPLVNDQSEWVVSLNAYQIQPEMLFETLTEVQRDAIKTSLENGQRAVFLSDHPFPNHEAVVQLEVPARYSSLYAPHLIGYVDGENNGVIGIENGYNDELSAYNGAAKMTYAVDALGRPARTAEEHIVNTVSRSKGGVALTLDAQIQRIVQEISAKTLSEGAVLVSDARSAQILASSSVPAFDPNDVEASLSSEAAPLLDRTLSNYNIGSVFKILIAASALEAGISIDTLYPCEGAVEVDGIMFACRDHDGKRLLTMNEAMAYSCNSYFIQLALTVGASRVADMAAKCGFDRELAVAKGHRTATALFPSEEELSVRAALANTAIGQGSMLASAYHVHGLMSAVANGGVWTEPTVYYGAVDMFDNLTPSGHEPQQTTLFSSETAGRLSRMLEDVVSFGTGRSAAPENTTAAGKTGTAETGWAKRGEEVVQSWFTGMLPADHPQYVITVLFENGGTSGRTAAPIFAEISDALFEAGLVENSQELY